MDYEFQEYLNTVRISTKGIAGNCPCRISGNYVSIHRKTHNQVNITSPKVNAVQQSLHFLTSLPLIHLWTFCHLCGWDRRTKYEREREVERKQSFGDCGELSPLSSAFFLTNTSPLFCPIYQSIWLIVLFHPQLFRSILCCETLHKTYAIIVKLQYTPCLKDQQADMEATA